MTFGFVSVLFISKGRLAHPHRNCNVHVEAEEEWNRIPIQSRRITDAVNSGYKFVIGDSLQEVADVHDECPTDGSRRDVHAVLVEDFQASNHVLIEDCEGCMRVSVSFSQLPSRAILSKSLCAPRPSRSSAPGARGA